MKKYLNTEDLEKLINWRKQPIMERSISSIYKSRLCDFFINSDLIAYSPYFHREDCQVVESACIMLENGQYVLLQLEDKNYGYRLNSEEFDQIKVAKNAIFFENIEEVMNYLMSFRGDITWDYSAKSYRSLFFEIAIVKKYKFVIIE